MKYNKEYTRKLTTPENAISVIQSGDWVEYGFCAMTTDILDKALAQKMPELYDVKLRGGILLKKPAVFNIDSPGKHFVWNSLHSGNIERLAIDNGYGYYIPIRYSELPRYYRESYKVDVALLQVTSMDSHGYFNFGPSVSHLKAMSEKAKIIIVEINKSAPYCHGGKENSIHISQVDFIVEGDSQPIPEMTPPIITDVDKVIAKLVVEKISNGACLQIGIGGMPSAIGSYIAQSDLKDLGVHSEMYVDAFVEIAEAGKISGSKKSIDKYRQAFTFAAGTQKLYNYINDNPECLCSSVDYINDIRVLASLDNFISINNAVNIDLFGQINSETSGLRHISGAGGQLDFVLGAYLSNGGKSFICCSSTYRDKHGMPSSRLMPTLNEGSVVTDTRANIHYLVTEYGVANLKGLPTWQKAEAIISLAHPDFRESLIQKAEEMKIWRHSNKRL